MTWSNAMSAAAGLNSGECGLSDGSNEGDWQLPTWGELRDMCPAPPMELPGLPFYNVQEGYYWTPDTYEPNNERAYVFSMGTGTLGISDKDDQYHPALPLRIGN